MKFLKSLARYFVAWVFVFGLLFGFDAVFAQIPVWFSIQVLDTPLDINQETDVIVTALRPDGSIETAYEGTILMFFDSNDNLDDSFFEVPNGGLFTFSLSNQWVQTFSKALKVGRSWEFEFIVSDLTDATIEGQATVVVGSDPEELDNLQNVLIDSPTSGGTVTTSILNILWRSDVARAPLQIIINGELMEQESETDLDWDYNVFISDLDIGSGENILQVRILNFEWQIIGKSELHPFIYNPPESDGLFKWLTVSPSTTIEAWEKFTFLVETDSTVNSVQLKIGNLVRPLTKDTPTTFSNDVLLEDWTFDVDVTIILDSGERRLYEKQSVVTVTEKILIEKLKLVRDNLNPDDVQLSWEISGWDADEYIIMYGTQADLLNNREETTDDNFLFEELLEETYYFQVTPVDLNWDVIGDASDIVSISLWEFESGGTSWNWSSNANCSIQWITVSTSRIGDTYYLVWWSVSGATNYVVYRSEFATSTLSQMQKIWETSDTKFPYPFDPFAVEDQYSHYAVQAICSDGQWVQLWSTTKVKVWPVTDLFFLFALTLLWYLLYVLFGYTRQKE